MLEKLRNPKNVKMISLIIAAVFVLGCFGIAMTYSGFNGMGMASAAGSDSSVGVVNYGTIVQQCPELDSVRTQMAKAIDDSQKQFEEKAKNMNNEEKERYFKQLQERLANTEKELMEPVLKNINDNIQKIADKKGLKVVVDKSTVIYGGTDITEEVIRALVKKK